MRPIRVLILLVVVSGISCSSSGKSDDRKPVHPVQGTLFVQGKPAAGAFVLFVPLNEPAEPKDPRPRAEVDKNGSFLLSTYDNKDGAPAGEYIVTVTWAGGEDVEDRLMGRFSDPKTSKLRATVKEGKNELAPFQLK